MKCKLESLYVAIGEIVMSWWCRGSRYHDLMRLERHIDDLPVWLLHSIQKHRHSLLLRQRLVLLWKHLGHLHLNRLFVLL